MWSKSTVFTLSSKNNRNFPLQCLTQAHSHSYRASLYAAPERRYRVLNLTAMCPGRALIQYDMQHAMRNNQRLALSSKPVFCGRALNGQKNQSRPRKSTFQITTIRSATADGTEHEEEDMCFDCQWLFGAQLLVGER